MPRDVSSDSEPLERWHLTLHAAQVQENIAGHALRDYELEAAKLVVSVSHAGRIKFLSKRCQIELDRLLRLQQWLRNNEPRRRTAYDNLSDGLRAFQADRTGGLTSVT